MHFETVLFLLFFFFPSNNLHKGRLQERLLKQNGQACQQEAAASYCQVLNGSCERRRIVKVDLGQLADHSGNENGCDRLSSRKHCENWARQVEFELSPSCLDDVKVVEDSEAEVAAVGRDEADGSEDG